MTVKVRRIRANNPSAMTGTGTNSYLVGIGQVVLIDPGPDDPRHMAALLDTLTPDERIEAILVTHAHLDHSALAPRIAAQVNAPVMAFGTADAGRSPLMQSLIATGLSGGGEGVDMNFHPDETLHDNQTLHIGETQIAALHTPGHMGNHLCFACGDILFSGDHVMGWASSLVSPPDGDMGAYITSLHRLAAVNWSQMLPGHGEPVTNPAARLAELIAHRQTREAQVLGALSQSPGTAADLAARIYQDTPAALLPAAARNVLAHLIDLSDRNLAHPQGEITAQTIFAAT